MLVSQILLVVGAGIGLLLGLAHGRMTLLDTFRPRFFTPVDDSVRIAMEKSQRLRMMGTLPVGANTNVWRAWLGFNLSHSLGVIVLSAILLGIAAWHYPLFAASSLIQGTVVLTAAAYLVLSIRFWFIAPTIGIAIMLGCFIGAVIFQ